jgi:hypothetical protein
MNTFGAFSKGSTLRLGVAVFALVGASILLAETRARPAVAQPQTRMDTLSAPLLRRLAEAADALRDGNVNWMVVDTAPPYEVSGVYPTALEASHDTMLPRGFRVRGPFRTPIDFGLPDEVFVTCPHTLRPNPSAYMPPPQRICPGRPIWLSSIRSLELRIRTRTDSVIIPLNPNEVDALFFNVSAFDKFLAPYYTRLYGPQFAQQLRDAMEAVVRRAR